MQIEKKERVAHIELELQIGKPVKVCWEGMRINTDVVCDAVLLKLPSKRWSVLYVQCPGRHAKKF